MLDARGLRAAAGLVAATAWGSVVSVREGVPGEPLGIRARGTVAAQLVRGAGSGLAAPWPMVVVAVVDALAPGADRRGGRASTVVGVAMLAGVAVEPVTWGLRQRSPLVASTVVTNVAAALALVRAGRRAHRDSAGQRGRASSSTCPRTA